MIFKKSLILLLCLSTIGATGVPSQLDRGVFIMKIIILKSLKYGDKECFVDDEDYELVSKFKWSLSNCKGFFYAETGRSKKDKRMRMHRFVVNCPKGMVVDHIDHNSLNNQKQNLRVCTKKENSRNRVCNKGATSKYLGVSRVCETSKYFRKKTNDYGICKSKTPKWLAQTNSDGIHFPLGTFCTEIEAAKAYDKKAKELFGEFANLNFPETTV